MSDPIDWNDDPRLVAYALGELDGADRVGKISQSFVCGHTLWKRLQSQTRSSIYVSTAQLDFCFLRLGF